MTTLDNAPGTTPNESGASMSRRTLVRAGATAVWAVPAIQLATAAPALAASANGTPATFAVSSTGTRNGSNLPLVVSISNSGSVPSGSPITCTVTLSATTGRYSSYSGVALAGGSAWTTVSGSSNLGTHTLVFSYAGSLPAGGPAPTLSFTVSLNGTNLPAGNSALLSISAAAPGDTTGNATPRTLT